MITQLHIVYFSS